MKKLLFIISIMLLSFTLFSCTESANYSIDRVLDRVDVIYAEGDNVFSVTQHVILPSKTDLNKSAVLSWSSDQPYILDEFGTVNRPDENAEVVLTVKVMLNNEVREKKFYIIIIGKYQFFDVIFEVDGVNYGTFKVKDGDLVEPIDDPIINGFSFEGWYTADDEVNEFDFNTPITDNIKLVAKLDVLVLADYTIEYYNQNILDDAYTLVSTEVLEGRVGFMASATIDVYGFQIDFEQSILAGVIKADDSLVLKVYLERNTYSITFISEGVELSANQYKYGFTLNENTEPQKDGHVLVGWATTPSGTTPYIFPYIVSNDLTFYAIWRLDDGYTYEGYYDGADGLSGIDLRTFLRMRVNNGKTLVDYGTARYVLDDTDRDPNNANNLILVYLGTSVSGVWDGGSTWNREHVWPQSLLGVSAVNNVANAASDLQNLKPANPAENSSRSNKYFDNVTNAHTYNPRDAVKGDIARILMYMDLAYSNLNLVNTYPATYQMGKLDVLLQWHLQDPVDDFERNRNEIIFGYQNNRNPFIDHPEFVEKIWGPITLTASNNETFTIELDFPSMFETIEIISYDILYIDFKKESKYLV
jgi:uncharacterized repeat protein (TIGR02543 family)